jgi:demethylmenaquinone methyltransferase/2-methoxy-6-polyprenyl-1,4-benzoquinol methylase
MSKRDYRQHILYYYNRFAKYYDLGEIFRRDTRNRAVALSRWQPGDRVLDVCTGTGEQAMAYARLGAKVVGVDIARGVLECAAAKTACQRPAWLEMDATELSFRDKAFDVSTISFILHHMPESVQRRLLTEVARVTRKRIVIIEPHTPTNPRLQPIWAVIHARFDESEYHQEWSRQDFAATCRSVNLQVEAVQLASLGIHRLTACAVR